MQGAVGRPDLKRLSHEVMATLHWVDWYNNHPLFGPIGYIPPAEAEAT